MQGLSIGLFMMTEGLGNYLALLIKGIVKLWRKDGKQFIQASMKNREYVYRVAVYQKYLTRLEELIIFEPWRENCRFSQPS